jgi:hypothetical protein
MIKGSDVRKTQIDVDALFLDRWSPRAMSGEAIDPSELAVLFEAARWAIGGLRANRRLAPLSALRIEKYQLRSRPVVDPMSARVALIRGGAIDTTLPVLIAVPISIIGI